QRVTTSDRPVKHRLFEKRDDFRRVFSVENARPLHTGLHLRVDQLGGDGRAGPEQRSGVGRRLEQAGNEERIPGLDDEGSALHLPPLDDPAPGSSFEAEALEDAGEVFVQAEYAVQTFGDIHGRGLLAPFYVADEGAVYFKTSREAYLG